jgi:hypothetical protein
MAEYPRPEAEDEVLASAQFFLLDKSLPDGEADPTDASEGPWRFSGVASDESPDVDDDEILRKTLDLTYANQRGFVNWEHSSAPEDQVGWLEKAELIPPGQVKKFAERIGGGIKLSKTATVYVEGFLRKYVDRARHVANLLKSSPPGKGVGLSLQGALARDGKSGNIVKALVRGVAITAVPAHPNTLVSLAKSLRAGEARPVQKSAGDEMVVQVSLDKEFLRAEIARQVEALRSPGEGGRTLTRAEAVEVIGNRNPHWPYELVDRAVEYAIQTRAKES